MPHSFMKICGKFHVLGCTHSEEPGVWDPPRKAVFEQNMIKKVLEVAGGDGRATTWHVLNATELYAQE